VIVLFADVGVKHPFPLGIKILRREHRQSQPFHSLSLTFAHHFHFVRLLSFAPTSRRNKLHIIGIAIMAEPTVYVSPYTLRKQVANSRSAKANQVVKPIKVGHSEKDKPSILR